MHRRELTVVLPYYENPGMLACQFAQFRKLPKAQRVNLHLIVVDDGSPRAPAKPDDIGMWLSIFRMKVDKRWNQDACRNLGMLHAETEWAVLTDIDHLIPEATMECCLGAKLRPENVYTFARQTMLTKPLPDRDPAPTELSGYKPHPNSWLISQKIWGKVGGYDERFAGWYGTDSDFRERLAKEAERVIAMSVPIWRVPRDVVPDASTTTYARKTPEDGENIRRIKGERAALQSWAPLTGLTESELVFDSHAAAAA